MEPSLDSNSWAKREQRYTKNFEAGRKYIPQLFAGMEVGNDIDQIALFIVGSRANVTTLAGGRVAVASDFFSEVVADLKTTKAMKQAVPEQFALLRTIQFAMEYDTGQSGAKPFIQK